MCSIQQARADVHRCIVAAAQTVDGPGPEHVAIVESQLWIQMFAHGRALMVRFFARQAARVGTASYERDGVRFAIVGAETAEVGTQFRKIAWQRLIGRVVGKPRSMRELPLDRQLGLPRGFTPVVVGAMAHLCAHMAFGAARKLFAHLFEGAPSPRAISRMVDAAGAEARPFLEQAPRPEGDGEVLVIQVDGKGAPAISSKEYARRTQPHAAKAVNRRHGRRTKRHEKPKARRAPGKKSKNAKMAAVGVLYTLRRDEDGRLDGPTPPRSPFAGGPSSRRHRSLDRATRIGAKCSLACSIT